MANHSSGDGVLDYELNIESTDLDCLVKQDNDLYIFQPDKFIVIYRKSNLH
jgi:hypothetical protein